MSNKRNVILMPQFVIGLGIMLVGAVIYHFSSPVYEAEASIALKHKDDAIIDLGRLYMLKTVAHVMVLLSRAANWRQRDVDGYLPAPYMMKLGIHGITLTHTSF